jgi:hypothetical protein
VDLAPVDQVLELDGQGHQARDARDTSLRSGRRVLGGGSTTFDRRLRAGASLSSIDTAGSVFIGFVSSCRLCRCIVPFKPTERKLAVTLPVRPS